MVSFGFQEDIRWLFWKNIALAVFGSCVKPRIDLKMHRLEWNDNILTFINFHWTGVTIQYKVVAGPSTYSDAQIV
jgi:hypothetical protein